MKIGMITIGQSPRDDVVLEVRDILGNIEIVERGCLDGFTTEQIESLRPRGKEFFVVTLLRDGVSVQVAKEKATELLQKRIRELEMEDVNLITVLCTEDFRHFRSKKLIIEPGKLIQKLVQGILGEGKRVGVIIPSSGQIEQTRKKWGDMSPVITVAPPYENPDEIETAAKTLKENDVTLTVLDCIGYTKQAKQKVQKITGKPVILPRTILARVIRELTNSA